MKLRTGAGSHPLVAEPPARPVRCGDGAGPAKYLRTIVDRGAHALRSMDDGRQMELSRLAYQVGGLLAWSGLNEADVEADLIDAGCLSGLSHARAARTVRRALSNGAARPYTPASARSV